MLYMPGSNARALEKAKGLPADSLILDLEDAVAPDQKEAARALVAEAVASRAYGERKLLIRINGLDTPWGEDDLAAAVAAGPDAVLSPKAGSGAEITEIAQRMDALGRPPHTRLWVMIETPAGVLNAAAIATANPVLEGFVLGTNDLVKDLGAAHTEDRAPIQTALQWSVLAARAAGLYCLDGVHNAFKDEAGLRRACEQAKAMGYDGKTLVHPAQIATANAVFAPAEAELEDARATIAAFEAATAKGEGVAVLNGKIVENLHVETARATLAKAEAIARLDAATAGG